MGCRRISFAGFVAVDALPCDRKRTPDWRLSRAVARGTPFSIEMLMSVAAVGAVIIRRDRGGGLGGCWDYGIARFAPHNQRGCQQQTAKHDAHWKRQKESRDIAKIGAPGADRYDCGPIACGPGGCHVEARFLRENKGNGPGRDYGRDRYSDRDRMDHVTYAVTNHSAKRSGSQHSQPVEAIR